VDIYRHIENGSWQGLWNAYGLSNADVVKPGATVSPPVILVIDDEAFMEIPNLKLHLSSEQVGTAR